MSRKLVILAFLFGACTKHIDPPVILNAVPKSSLMAGNFILLDPSASTGAITKWTWDFDSSVTPAVPYIVSDSIKWYTPRSFSGQAVNAPTELYVPVKGKYWFRLTVYDDLGGWSSGVTAIQLN